MAFASVASLGSGSDKVAGSTIAITVAADAAIDDIVIVVMAQDNESSSDGNTTEASGVTDSGGNTYTKLREYCSSGGATDAGVTLSVWFSKLDTGLTNGASTLTGTFSTSTVDASAISAWKFTVGAGNTVQIAGTPIENATTGTTGVISQTIGSLSSKEYLFLRSHAGEAGTVAWAATASFTALTAAGTAGGAAQSNVNVCGEFQILTATGVTSDPTQAYGLSTHQQSDILLALEEVAEAAGGLSIPVAMHYYRRRVVA